MESLIIIIYILLFSLSCVGSGCNYFIHKVFKLPLTKNLFFLFFTLLVDIGRSLFYTYFHSIGRYPNFLFPLDLIIGLLIVSIFYFYIYKSLILLNNIPTLLLRIFSAAILLIQIIIRIILYYGRSELANFTYPILVVLITGYLFFVGILLKKGVDKNWNYALKTFVRKIGIFTIIYAPLSAVFYITQYIVQHFSHDSLVDLFYLDFLYLGISSIVSISFLLNYLTKLGTIPYKTKLDQNQIDTFSISPRENEVLELILKGLSNKQICDSLCISISTVRTHISHIFEKTEVRSRMELVSKLLSS